MKHAIFLSFAALLAARLLIAVFPPVFETSEARYAALSANMARTGDFLVPRYTYANRYQSFDGKPPLLFQTAGLAAKAFGVNEFAVRLPVLLAGVFLVAFLGFGVRRLAAACGDAADTATSRGILAAGIGGTCVAFYALAGFCIPDGLLVACVGSAFLAHALFLATGRRSWSLAVFAALALGMLVKGPVALALFGGGVLLDTGFNHRWAAIARYRWFSGFTLFLLIAGPWFVLMARVNPDFLSYFFIHENLLRFLTHNYGDKYGAGREYFRGVAALWLVVVTLPWFPLALWNRSAFRRWRDGRVDSLFLWGTFAITGFWCLTSRVPIGYMIPVVPLVAAAFALRLPRERLPLAGRLIPWATLVAVLALTGTLVSMRLTSDKLDGAQSPYRDGRYAYEFYHGTPDFAKAPAPKEEGK